MVETGVQTDQANINGVISKHYPRLTDVTRQYLSGSIDVEGALASIHCNNSPDSRLTAAKIELDAGSKQPKLASFWLNKAERDLNLASEYDAGNVSVMEARTLLMQYPVYEKLLCLKRLPTQAEAETAYFNTIRHASNLCQLSRRFFESSGDIKKYQRVIGLIGEISILALMQRSAIRTGTTSERFAIKSFLSEDQCFQPGMITNPGWDISDLAYDRLARIYTRNKVQVKSSAAADYNSYFHRPPPDPAIKLVHLDPDIKLWPDERVVATNIIHTAEEELLYRGDQDCGKRLDARTVLLYNIVDAPSTVHPN